MKASAKTTKAIEPTMAAMFQGRGVSGLPNQNSAVQVTTQAVISGAARASMFCSEP